MASKQTNTNEYIEQAVVKAARVAVQTMSSAGTARAENMGPRMSRPIMQQPTSDWSAKDKYAELRNFKVEVQNVLQNCNISQNEEYQF